jgi:hypothetical protein
MNAVLVNMGRGTGIVLGLLLATAAYGQAPTPTPISRPGVIVEKPKQPLNPTGAAHRMEIQNGRTIGIRLFGKDLAPSEMAALRDLERAENEASYAELMADLRYSYLRNEMEMEARRHNVQLALYGTSTFSTSGGFAGACGSPAAYQMGYAALPNGLSLVANPFATSTVYPGQAAYNRLYPNVYTPGYWGDSFTGTVSTFDSLQNGMGDEGVMKNEIVKGMSAGYTRDSVTAANRNLDNAVNRIAYMPKVRDALNGPEPGRVVPVATPGAVTLTLKDIKEPLKGKLVGEDGDFLVVQTDTEEVRVRKEDVVRSARPLKQP